MTTGTTTTSVTTLPDDLTPDSLRDLMSREVEPGYGVVLDLDDAMALLGTLASNQASNLRALTAGEDVRGDALAVARNALATARVAVAVWRCPQHSSEARNEVTGA